MDHTVIAVLDDVTSRKITSLFMGVKDIKEISSPRLQDSIQDQRHCGTVHRKKNCGRSFPQNYSTNHKPRLVRSRDRGETRRTFALDHLPRGRHCPPPQIFEQNPKSIHSETLSPSPVTKPIDPKRDEPVRSEKMSPDLYSGSSKGGRDGKRREGGCGLAACGQANHGAACETGAAASTWSGT